jgi:hypothetical protein
MALFILSVKIGFEIVGCILVALCFMRGFLAYLGNLLDLAIYHLHVKNSATVSPETEEAIEKIVAEDQRAKTETKRSSSPLKVVCMWAVCFLMGYVIFRVIR